MLSNLGQQRKTRRSEEYQRWGRYTFHHAPKKGMDDFIIPCEDTISILPKVDLHRHIGGSIRLSTLFELAQADNIALMYKGNKLKPQCPEDLRQYIVKKNSPSLEEYLTAFPITESVMQTSTGLWRTAYEAVEDAALDSVVYLELRYSPTNYTKSGMGLNTIIEVVLDALSAAQEDYPSIRTNLILSAPRHDIEKTLITAGLIQKYYHSQKEGEPDVVGFDLCGPEHGFPVDLHQKAFQVIADSFCRTTIHAGEAYGPDSIKQALDIARAKRIGHATNAMQNPRLLNFMLKRRIGLELCISSNMDTLEHCVEANHPADIFFRKGLRLSVCTDNPTISDTTSTKEYHIAAEHLHLTLGELKQITIQALKSSFLSYDERTKLVKSIAREHLSKIFERSGSKCPFQLAPEKIERMIRFSEQMRKYDVYVLKDTPSRDDTIKPSLGTVERLPKIDLHRHFAGSAHYSLIYKLAKGQSGGILPVFDPKSHRFVQRKFTSGDELCEYIQSASKGSLNNYLSVYPTIEAALQRKDALEELAFEVVKDAAEDNVVYLEMRMSPTNHLKGNLNLFEVGDAVLSGMARAQQAYPSIRSNVIFSGPREDPQACVRTAGLLRRLYLAQGKGAPNVVGFDLCGMDKDYPISHYYEALKAVKDIYCPMTIHAGEDAGADYIKEAIFKAWASRIGHATRIWENPKLVDLVRDERICLELCPTNDVNKIGWIDYSTHPLRDLLDADLRLAICTNAPRILNTTSTLEYYYASKYMDLSLGDLKVFTVMALKASFMPFNERKAFMQEIIQQMGKIFEPAGAKIIEPKEKDIIVHEMI